MSVRIGAGFARAAAGCLLVAAAGGCYEEASSSGGAGDADTDGDGDSDTDTVEDTDPDDCWCEAPGGEFAQISGGGFISCGSPATYGTHATRPRIGDVS